MKTIFSFLFILALISINSAKQDDRKSILKSAIKDKIEEALVKAGHNETLADLMKEFEDLKEEDHEFHTYWNTYFWPIFFPISLLCLVCFILAICLCVNCKKYGRHWWNKLVEKANQKPSPPTSFNDRNAGQVALSAWGLYSNYVRVVIRFPFWITRLETIFSSTSW